MELHEQLIRLEDALADLVVLVCDGQLDRLDAHLSPEVVRAGKRLQDFHRAITGERA